MNEQKTELKLIHMEDVVSKEVLDKRMELWKYYELFDIICR